MGLFAVGMVTVAYREKGKFRRLAVTPLPKWVFPPRADPAPRHGGHPPDDRAFSSRPGSASGSRTRGSYVLFAALVVCGTATFLAMGFALSSFASTVETYGAISNLMFFPMMLLSGVYFRLDKRAAVDAGGRLGPAALAVPPRLARGVQRRRDARGPRRRARDPGEHGPFCRFVLAVKRFRWV